MVLHAKCRRAVHVVINTVTHQAVKTATFSIAYPRRFGVVRLIEQILIHVLQISKEGNVATNSRRSNLRYIASQQFGNSISGITWL